MQGVLDMQRDHAVLIGQCMRMLSREGLLVFSTNAQKFALDPAFSEQFRVADISAATLPFDFQGNPRIHRCFELRHREYAVPIPVMLRGFGGITNNARFGRTPWPK